MRKSILTYIFLLFGLFGTVSGQNLEIVLDSTFTNLKLDKLSQLLEGYKIQVRIFPVARPLKQRLNLWVLMVLR